MKTSFITACLVWLFVLSGCTVLGSLSKPSEHDMLVSARSIKVSSADEAFRDIQFVFRRVKYSGKYIFDECSTDAINKAGIDVTCTMYEEDRTYQYIDKKNYEKYPTFRLKSTGTYSLTVPLCPADFRSVRQFPLFLTHYFFVNGFCFEGDKERALRAYHLLKYYCEH